MSTTETLERSPRQPWRWLTWLIASQLLVAAVWWAYGWKPGLPLLLLSHGLFVAPVFLPNSRFYAPVLSHWPDAGQRVWLTIDDGPSADTAAILDLLARHQARATFFVVGQRAAAQPELVRQIVAAGHSLGNHSHSHPQGRWWMLGPRALRAQIGQCQQALSAITGQPPRWYRSVVGHTNPFVAAVLKAHGLTRVGWGARGFDGVRCEPATVLARITPQLAPGAIVLLHEGGAPGQALTIIGAVLEELQRRGLRADIPG